jgi:uncharacterized 2Fe-2S/4Fe-4S cluster protein (DUF4445 family)
VTQPDSTLVEDDALVIFMPSGRRGRVKKGTSLLDAARQLGVDIESICGGRLTCGKCKVSIENGNFQKHGIISDQIHLSPPIEDERLLLESIDAIGCRLSCSAHVQGDALVFVPEESRAQKQVIRKSATERSINVIPAIRQVYVEVDLARLGEHRGDWGRLQSALSEQWQLKNLTIDLPALRRLQGVLRKGKWAVTVTLWQGKEVIDVQPGYKEGIFGLAVDIGSTTVAGYLCDLRTGDVLITEATMNPQVIYGEDLMSRVSYAMTNKDGLDKMHSAIIEALNKLSARAARAAGIQARNIHEMVVVGNTTMVHIFLGINPSELGGAPFALANREAMDFKARELGLRLHRGANVHIMPAEAGHVGADNIGVLIAEEPYQQKKVVLTVDVGTNAEIVLGNRDWMYSASSPTGPAFEGAQITYGMRAAPGAIERVRIDPITKVPRFRVIGEELWSDQWDLNHDGPANTQPNHLAVGICGSGIIEAVVEMYLAGILLPDGRFNPEAESDLIEWNGRKGAFILASENETATGESILVTQDDVRNIQLAKAALYAGAKLLMNRAGNIKIDRIVLAGAFGSYIDPKYAMILGLIPDCDLKQVYAVGNAAGDGARIALLNREKRREAQEIAYWVKYIETAVDPEFQNEFVDAIHLPHASDSFPHLHGLLPTLDADRPRTRTRRHRRSVRPSASKNNT